MECGIPQQIASSDRSWIYVLLHGDDALASGWDSTWVTQDQAEKLLRFLESELTTEVGYDLVRKLRERAKERV
jgi:hypothetical protein